MSRFAGRGLRPSSSADSSRAAGKKSAASPAVVSRRRRQAMGAHRHSNCSKCLGATVQRLALSMFRTKLMITEDQTPIIDFLAAPSTHGGVTVERIDTHASIVFLAGARAYKLKRAVRFDYLDFSTSERRRSLCEAEVRLNRRTAPTLYRGVVAVTRQDDGSYALGGNGTPVDWLVEMNRFPQEALFDRLASAGALGIELMSPLAAAIADFHKSAEHRPDHGGKAGMSWVDRRERCRIRGVRSTVSGSVGGVSRDRRLVPRARSPCGDCSNERREVRFRPSVSRRPPFAQHRAAGRTTDAVRRRRVQRRDFLHRRLLRSRVSPDGSLAATDCRAMPTSCGTVTWSRRQTSTASLSCRCFCPAGRLFAPRRARRRHNFKKTLHAAVSSRAWRASISPWPNTCCIRHTLASSRLEVSRARESRHSRSVLRRRSAPSRVRWCCAATRRGSVCAVFLCCSALVRKDTHRKCPSACTPPWQNRPPSSSVQATASSSMRSMRGRPIGVSLNRLPRRPRCRSSGCGSRRQSPLLIERTVQRRNDASDADADVVRMQRAQDTGHISWSRLDASTPSASVLSSALDRVRERLGDGARNQRATGPVIGRDARYFGRRGKIPAWQDARCTSHCGSIRRHGRIRPVQCGCRQTSGWESGSSRASLSHSEQA